jgi:hypothetical protein
MMWLSGIGFLYCDLGEKFETPALFDKHGYRTG